MGENSKKLFSEPLVYEFPVLKLRRLYHIEKKIRWFVKSELIFHLFFIYSSKGFTISAKESAEYSSVKNSRKRKYLLGPAFVWHYSFRNWGSNPPGQFHVLCSDKTEAKKTTKIWIKKSSNNTFPPPKI